MLDVCSVYVCQGPSLNSVCISHFVFAFPLGLRIPLFCSSLIFNVLQSMTGHEHCKKSEDKSVPY